MTLSLFFKLIACATVGAIYCVASRSKADERFIFFKCVLLSTIGALSYNFGPKLRDIYFKDMTFSFMIPVLSIFLLILFFLWKRPNIKLKRNSILLGIFMFLFLTFLMPAAQRLVMGDYYMLQNATSEFHQVFRIREFKPLKKVTPELQKSYDELSIPAYNQKEEEIEQAVIAAAFIDNEWDMSTNEVIMETLEKSHYSITHYPGDKGDIECILDLPRKNQTYVAIFKPQGDGTYYMRYVVCGVTNENRKTGGFQRDFLV